MPAGQQRLSLKASPRVRFSFRAKQDNLGVLTFNLRYVGYEVPNVLLLKIKEKGAENWYAESSFRAVEVGNSTKHPFGFPLISNSRNKDYIIEMSMLERGKRASWLELNLAPHVFQSVHQLNKTQVIKQPAALLSLLSNKVVSVVVDSEARMVFLYLLPMFFISLPIISRRYAEKYER